MKRRRFNILFTITMVIFALGLINTLIFSTGQQTALKPKFGQTPAIDGLINEEVDEWENSLKITKNLYKNLSEPVNGLAIDLWIMQDDQNLFLAIQFEFEDHNSSEFDEEFIGILISGDDPDDPPIYLDAKIIQFMNITTGEYIYADYWLNNSIYYLDDQNNGEGGASLDNDKVIYEFSIPVDVLDETQQDVYVRSLFTYAFSIVYGKTPLYPEGIILSNYELIEIQVSQYKPPFNEWEMVQFLLNIIIFGTIGAFYFLYIYRITKLKEKVRRIRG